MVRAVTLVILLHETGGEAGLLHRPVRHELDPQAVAGRLDVLGHFVSTEGSDQL